MSQRRERTTWLSSATKPPVVRRAIGLAVVVGPILILINHGDALFGGEVTPIHLLKMGLTVTAPYLVSTCSSVSATRSMRNKVSERQL